MIKKIFIFPFLCFALLGCGNTDLIEQTIDTGNNTKYNLAKNYVLSYANAVVSEYTNYKYNVLLNNDYIVNDGLIVNVDGFDVKLNVNGYDDISCSNVMIIDDSVKLSDCYIYGFTFIYENGNVIQK